MAVLCGNAAETCYTKYGSVSIRGKNCHEIALRIVLQCIESHANRYGRYIVSSVFKKHIYQKRLSQIPTQRPSSQNTYPKNNYFSNAHYNKNS